MPTQPDTDFIPRKYSSPEEEQMLRNMYDLCEEVVNFGSRAYQRCRNTPREGAEYLLMLAFLHHSVEIIDAISVLVLPGCIEPCKVHLRALLESALSIEWIIAGHFKQRANAYLVLKAYRELRLIDKLDPDTEIGKKLRERLRKHSSGPLNLDEILNALNFSELRRKKQNLINSEDFREIKEEYERVRKYVKRPPWYSLFPTSGDFGPTNIECLASELSHLDWYEFLYRHWSESVHATDVLSGQLAPGSISGRALFYQIRLARNANVIVWYTAFLGYHCIRLTTKGYHEKFVQEVDEWFDKELKGAFGSLAKMKITVT